MKKFNDSLWMPTKSVPLYVFIKTSNKEIRFKRGLDTLLNKTWPTVGFTLTEELNSVSVMPVNDKSLDYETWISMVHVIQQNIIETKRKQVAL